MKNEENKKVKSLFVFVTTLFGIGFHFGAFLDAIYSLRNNKNVSKNTFYKFFLLKFNSIKNNFCFLCIF